MSCLNNFSLISSLLRPIFWNLCPLFLKTAAQRAYVCSLSIFFTHVSSLFLRFSNCESLDFFAVLFIIIGSTPQFARAFLVPNHCFADPKSPTTENLRFTRRILRIGVGFVSTCENDVSLSETMLGYCSVVGDVIDPSKVLEDGSYVFRVDHGSSRRINVDYQTQRLVQPGLCPETVLESPHPKL